MYKAVIVSLGLFLTSCQSDIALPPEHPPKKPSEFTGTAMTIRYRILVGEKLDPTKEHEIEAIVNQTFNEVDRIYNKWNPGSELSRLNRMKAHVKANISTELEQLLLLTDKVVKISQGRFDPTIEPAQQIWKSRLSENKRPTEAEIQRIKPAIGWEKVHFGDGIFYKDHDLTSLDLGGIAKGLAVDLILERLNQAGYQSLYVDWGGEIRTKGLHPEGRPWIVAISRFGNDDLSQAIAQIALKDQAIATSGDYEQYWTLKDDVGSETYFHVLNPNTCEPLKIQPGKVASASVCAGSCAFADGLATIGLTFESVEEAGKWADEVKKSYPEVAFWFSSREM